MSKYYHKKSAEERREEVDHLSNTLIDNIRTEISSGHIQGILDNISRFQYNYSLNNTLLIAIQKPEASVVGSYNHWKDVNRQVNQGEKGIQILCPVKYKYEADVTKMDPDTHKPVLDPEGNKVTERKQLEGLAFRIGYVFDVTQTHQIEGKPEIPLEVVKNLDASLGDRYSDLIAAVREASPVPIEIEKIASSANGYFSRDSQKIVVQDGMSEAQTFKTAIHEVAHSYLHNSQIDAGGHLTYYVAESERSHDSGVYREDLSLKEAVDLYKSIPDDHLNAGKVIGVSVDTDLGRMSFEIVQNGEIQMDAINSVPTLRDSLDVQKSVNDLRQFFPPDNYSIPSMREVQAEGTAYVVAAHYGINTEDYSIKYVSSWSNMEPNVVLENLNAVRSAATEIIGKMDDALERISEERKQNDTESLSDKILAEKLDKFSRDFDPHEYKDEESYPGSNYDAVLSEIRKGNTEGFKEFLDDVISDGRHMTQEAKDLLNDIEKYETSHIAVEESRSFGMKM